MGPLIWTFQDGPEFFRSKRWENFQKKTLKMTEPCGQWRLRGTPIGLYPKILPMTFCSWSAVLSGECCFPFTVLCTRYDESLSRLFAVVPGACRAKRSHSSQLGSPMWLPDPSFRFSKQRQEALGIFKSSFVCCASVSFITSFIEQVPQDQS